MPYTRILLATITALVCSACANLLAKMYGIQELAGFDQAAYSAFVAGIKENDDFYSIVSDTAQYKRVIALGKTPKAANVLGQPIQILYFQGNELKSFHANCYARGGLSNLNWNTANRFATFVPHTAVATDSLAVTLSDYSNIYPDIALHQKEYTVLIFWTLMLGKISKSAIEVVTDNIKQAGKEKQTTVILINTDKYFAGMP